MTEGRDTTDDSVIWNPGETKGWKHGEMVDLEEPALAETEEGGAVTADVPQTKGATEKVGSEDTEVSTNTDMQPADAPTPSPASDLKENTNVETDALHEAIDDAGSVPEASDIEVSGEPTPVSEPNPVPGDADTAPVVTTENAGDVVSAPDVPAEPATVSNQPPTP